MKIISINAGSSSLKFSLFNMDDKKVIASGLFERIGIDGSSYTIKYNGEKIKEEIELSNHTDAVKILLDKLVTLNIIKSLDLILTSFKPFFKPFVQRNSVFSVILTAFRLFLRFRELFNKRSQI